MTSFVLGFHIEKSIRFYFDSHYIRKIETRQHPTIDKYAQKFVWPTNKNFTTFNKEHLYEPWQCVFTNWSILGDSKPYICAIPASIKESSSSQSKFNMTLIQGVPIYTKKSLEKLEILTPSTRFWRRINASAHRYITL